MEQTVLLCHSQPWVCQLGTLRGEASCLDVDLPLICLALGFLLAFPSESLLEESPTLQPMRIF